MAKFREFYVPAGAGSNFLASKCLWAGKDPYQGMHDAEVSSTNEYFFDRCISGASELKKSREDLWSQDIAFVCDDENLISETKRIKPILIELDRYMNFVERNNDNANDSNRELLITHIDDIWREDWSMYSVLFQIPSSHVLGDEIPPPEILNKIKQSQDYFAQCREYYFKLCERNDWDAKLISHRHPYNAISPRLKFPNDTKTLAMKIDAEVDMYIAGLLDVKNPGRNVQPEYTKLFESEEHVLYLNKSVEPTDYRVSYRKIFFENDRYEIRKIYEFFDNKAYFYENREQIMKEFNDYHMANMAVVQEFIPHLYEQIQHPET